MAGEDLGGSAFAVVVLAQDATAWAVPLGADTMDGDGDSNDKRCS